ncbi:MAG TPA: endolytic transglycosylase MltG [Solirubrobacteraceae bacterium]|nr:endolytic transglycosylase MltG [Solirubrobacteraceae bacterium]
MHEAHEPELGEIDEPAVEAPVEEAWAVEGEPTETRPIAGSSEPEVPTAEPGVPEPPVEELLAAEEPLVEGPPSPRKSRAEGKELLARRAVRRSEQRERQMRRRGRSTRARIVAVGALVAVALVIWFLLALFQPFAGAGSGRVIVAIPKGSSSSEIGSILSREGVVSSGFLFQLRALLEGRRGDLHSGRFELRRDMSYAAAIEALSKPPPAVIPVKIVIPEGETRRQIAQIARENGLTGSYLDASTHSGRLDPTHYGAPSGTPSLEGFLFPATYEMHAGAPTKELVEEQLVAFKSNFGAHEIARAHTLHLTPYELLIVASMIEREALLEHDRPLIAAVIYNRLKQGIPLGIDATIRYALDDFSAPLTEAQLHNPSPFNTRLHKGLPPTPIGNPGMASIEAAAHPAHSSYLYYVAGADGCGEMVFSRSYAKFERDAAAYREAVRRNGGRVPACKH